MNNNEHYDASDTQVLEGLEAVRKRPGMYIGSTSVKGLHHLVWEIVDNAIDEALAGYCDDIEIIVNKDGSITVKDDGRGIPVEVHPKTGLSTVETVYTVLHAGGKFGGGGYKVSGGLHGVGASVVNALSKWVEVMVYKEGKVYYIKFANGGKTIEPLKVIGQCSEDRTGTTVSFMPDDQIFKETTTFDYETLKTRVRELAFLNKGLKITLMDDRDSKKDSFVYEGGIKEFVEYLNQNRNPIHDDIVYVEGMENDISIEVALQYNDSYNSTVYSFVNNIITPEGGTHEDGVKLALTRIINNYAKNNKILKDNDEPLSGDDVREGITMIISAKVPEPQFEGQTKTKLGNSEVRKIAASIFAKDFERFLMEHPNDARIIIDKSMTAARARVAAKRARELTRRKGGLEITNYWGKLSFEQEEFEELEKRAEVLKNHADDFLYLYNNLEDYRSKQVLYGILNYWYNNCFEELGKSRENNFNQYFDLDLIDVKDNEVFVDVGAYTGDTILNYINSYGKYKHIYGYEITLDSIKIMQNNLKDYDNIIIKRKALSDTRNDFFINSNEASASANTLSNFGSDKVSSVTLDEDIKEKVTLIKMDIEGGEEKALIGAINHIKKDTPKLLISVYHNHDDLWKIPKLINTINENYKFYLRYFGNKYYPTEVVLMALPK